LKRCVKYRFNTRHWTWLVELSLLFQLMVQVVVLLLIIQTYLAGALFPVLVPLLLTIIFSVKYYDIRPYSQTLLVLGMNRFTIRQLCAAFMLIRKIIIFVCCLCSVLHFWVMVFDYFCHLIYVFCILKTI